MKEYFFIKKLVKANSSDMFCMSVINTQLCKQLSVQIEVEQGDEGRIPHMHIYLDKHRDARNCGYIRLDNSNILNIMRMPVRT